jgi:GDP-L-fucose synthase
MSLKQNRLFSYLFIDDLCRIAEYFINHETKHKIYNVAPYEISDLLSIAKRVNEVSKKNLEIIIHTPGMGKEYTADNSFLVNEIGDFKFTPHKEAIKELYEWYEKNKSIINRELLLYDP